MNWLTTLAFAVLLLSVQYNAVQSRSPTFTRSPWANPAKASSLMNCLITKIASSNVLPQQEKEDLESIMDTLMSAINGASAKGKISGAQLQAINMAVASSLAEIVVAEDVGNQVSMAVKTNALSDSLEQCFQLVMGTVDRKFINEINELISMFAKQAAAETNEIENQGTFYATDSSASSSFQSESQTLQESSPTTVGFERRNPGPQVSQPGTIDVGFQVYQPTANVYSGAAGSYQREAQFTSLPGPTSFSQTSGKQGAFRQITSAQSALISKIANQLANTSTLRVVFRSDVSQQTVLNVVQRTVQMLANNLGLDGNNMSRIALQVFSQISAGSDTSVYAQGLASVLVKAGIFNENNFETLRTQVFSSLLNGVSSAAQGLGINVDTANVQSDIRSSIGVTSTSTSSTSVTQSSGAASTTGFTGAGGYPGRTGPLGGGGQLSSLSLETSLGVRSGFSEGSLVQSAGFPSPGSGPSAGVSIRSALNSPNGLLSVSAAARISQLTSSIQSAIGPNGVDANALARSLQASFSSLQSSGMSSSDAKIEVLLETIVGLLQLLSNTQIRGVNMAAASSVSSSAARSFELVLA